VPGNCQVIGRRKGTAVSNTYQEDRHRAQPDRWLGGIAVLKQVVVPMAEIAESTKEGLLALAVGTMLQVVAPGLTALLGTPPNGQRLCSGGYMAASRSEGKSKTSSNQSAHAWLSPAT
jgi:hypothetical protein